MEHEGGFELVAVAVDDYPPGLGPLPSTKSVERLAERLKDWGAVSVRQLQPTSTQAIRTGLSVWASDQKGAPSSLVYWAGHGWDDGTLHYLCTSDTKLPASPANSIPAAELAQYLMSDAARRESSSNSQSTWTVVVLDCCGSSIGVTNIVNALTQTPARRPQRCVLVPVAEQGGAFAGRFVEKLGEYLDQLTTNDREIRLRELLLQVSDRLGDVQLEGLPPASIVLRNTGTADPVITVSLDALDELKAVIDKLPPHVRSHFLAKALGGETGELAWYFAGRSSELERLASWLRSADGGMLIVTGAAGAGKSAILGYLVTLADPPLMDALRHAQLIGEVPDAQRPPEGVFDATLHLTGMTDFDYQREIAAALGVDGAEALAAELRKRAATGRRSTVLVDALDESQEPLAIARRLQRLASERGVRVIVGTRRSLADRLDAPVPEASELLSALGDAETLEVHRESTAVADYAERRLLAPASPYRDEPDAARALAARIAGPQQTFLYARLAVGELRARPQLAPDEPAVDDLLRGDHVSLFAAAVDRLANEDESARPLLEALAWARGRGLPRAGGVWSLVALSLYPDAEVDEHVIDRVQAAAAPYVTLDGEAGQSTYRLAHQTFVEYMRRGRADGDGAIATGLYDWVERHGGWASANPYVVHYLPQHLTGDPDRLERLCTDPEYLRRALAVLGVDGLVELLTEAVEHSGRRAVDVVSAAIRRSRVGLARNPDQLTAQLYARLSGAAEPALRRMLDQLGETRGQMWLRARDSSLGWRNDLDVTQTLPGKARAVAFGTLEGSTAIVVGAGTYVHRWDPRSAAATPLPALSWRPTAVGAATLGGRSFVAAACGYDGVLQIMDVGAGEWKPAAPAASGADAQLILTALRGRLALGLLGRDGIRLVDAVTGDLLDEIPGVALAMADTPTGAIAAWLEDDRIRLRQLETGEPLGQSVGIFVDPQRWRRPAVAVAQVGRSLVVAIADGPTGKVEVWNALTAEPLGDRFRLDFAVRALAIGDVDGRILLAAVNDSDHESGFVRTREVSALRERHARPNIVDDPVTGVGRLGGALKAFSEGIGIVDLATGAVSDPDPAPGVVGTLLVGPPATRLAPEPHSCLPTHGRVQVTHPSEWPVTALAYGRLDERPVVVRGSHDGAVVVCDAETGTVLGTDGPPLPHGLYLGIKTSSTPVTDVAVGASAIAAAWDGAVRLYDGPSLLRLASDWITATAVRAVALGTVRDNRFLVTGGEGGGVALWDINVERRLAGITLDRPVAGVWLVHNEPLVVARTADRVFHVLDVVGD